MLKSRGFQTMNASLPTGPIDGLVKMDEKPGQEVGFKHGKHGFVKMSTGRMHKTDIKRDRTGIALVPQLSGRDWRLIDIAIDSQKADNPRGMSILPKDEPYWAEVLVQGTAALEPSPFEHMLTRLTRLKLQKPTQYMDEQAVSVFLEDICEHFERRGYCYHAIDEGIISLIEHEEDKFFPSMKILLKYIHPIHWKLKQRVDMLEKILKQNINKNVLPIENNNKNVISESDKRCS